MPRQCDKSGKFAFKGMCCHNHMEEARKYTSEELFNQIGEDYLAALGNDNLVDEFNDTIRFMFYETMLAGKARERAEFANKSALKHGQGASQAWQQAHQTTDNEQTKALQQQVQAINAFKNGFKRKKTDDCALDQLEGYVKPQSAPLRRRVIVKARAARPAIMIADDSDDDYEYIPVNGRRNRTRCVVEEVEDEEVHAPHHQPVHDDDVHYINDAVAYAAQQPLPEDDDEMDWD